MNQQIYCFYCDCEVFVGTRGGQWARRTPKATRDHVIPKSKVGAGSRIVSACIWCNQDKDQLTLEEYRVVQAFRFGYISGVEYRFPGEPNE